MIVSTSAGTEEHHRSIWTTSPKRFACPYFTMVHKPIAQNGAMKIAEAKVAIDKVWDKLKHLPLWDFKNAIPKSEVVQQAEKDGRSVHFTSLMDLSHLKHSVFEKLLPKHKGRVVPQESQRPGASASKMAAARFIGDHCQTPWHGWRGRCSVSLHSGPSV